MPEALSEGQKRTGNVWEMEFGTLYNELLSMPAWVYRFPCSTKGNVRAIYGKHSFADFDLKTGKLVGQGSD